MRAILIDTVSYKVLPIELNDKDPMQHMYDIIGCDLVERVTLPNGDDVWVDEEGWVSFKNRGGFLLTNPKTPLAGKAVVVGQSGEYGEDFGDCVSNVMGIEDVIIFFDNAYAKHLADRF